MSIYRQPYSLPFNGAVIGSGGLSLSDGFAGGRVQYRVGGPTGVIVPGQVELDPKWKLWDELALLRFAAVDARLQLAQLEFISKGLIGYYQQLPLPTANGQTLDLCIYGQTRISHLFTDPETLITDDVLGFAGLILGDDLLAAPTTSSVIMCGCQMQYQSGATTNVARGMGGVQFVAFDALPAPIGGAGYGFDFARIRLRQKRNGATNYDTTVTLEAGQFGCDWLPMGYIERVAQAAPIKSVGFGGWVGNTSSLINVIGRLQVDNFIVAQEEFLPGLGSAMGSTQSLGAV